MDKVRSTLKQLVRDWSEEGKGERETCYLPIIDALISHFPNILRDERFVPRRTATRSALNSPTHA